MDIRNINHPLTPYRHLPTVCQARMTGLSISNLLIPLLRHPSSLKGTLGVPHEQCTSSHLNRKKAHDTQLSQTLVWFHPESQQAPSSHPMRWLTTALTC